MRFQMSPDSEAFSNVSVSENEGLRFRSLQCGREVKTYRKRCVFKWKHISVVEALHAAIDKERYELLKK